MYGLCKTYNKCWNQKVIYANKCPDEEVFKILKEAEVKTQYFGIGKIKTTIYKSSLK